MIFKNSKGEDFTLEEVMNTLMEYISEADYEEYSLIIGTDSQILRRKTVYASVIVLHKVGKGARFFISKTSIKGRVELYPRLVKETEFSLEIARTLLHNGVEAFIPHDNIEIHIDIGHNGKSRNVIEQCVGWCQGEGWNWKIKPDAFAATHVADKYCRD